MKRVNFIIKILFPRSDNAESVTKFKILKLSGIEYSFRFLIFNLNHKIISISNGEDPNMVKPRLDLKP